MTDQYQINPQHEKLWTHNFVLTGVSSMVTFISFHILMPTLPVYVVNLGGTPSEVGLVVSFFSISALIVRPFIGRLVDIYGRKNIFLIGSFICILSCLAYSCGQTIKVLLMVRLLHGLGFGTSTTAAGTMIVDFIPKKRLGEGISYYGLAPTISLALAPAMGLYILNKFNFTVLLFLAALFAFLALMCGSLVKVIKASEPRVRFKLSLIEKSALRPALINFFVSFAFSSVLSFITLYIAEIGVGKAGIFFIVYAIVLALTRLVSGNLLDRKGYDIVVIPGIFSMLIAVIVLSKAHYLVTFVIAAIFLGIALGNIIPSMQVLAVKNVPFNRRGAAISTFFNAFDLGVASGSLFWGVVSQWYGFSTMYLLSTVPIIAALILYIGTSEISVKLNLGIK